MSLAPLTAVERRLASLQAWVIGGLAFMFVATVTGILSLVFISAYQSNNLSAKIAKSDRALSCYVNAQLDRASKTLPTLAYYKEHPDELVAARESISTQRADAVKAWGLCVPSHK